MTAADPDVRTLADGRTILAECRSGGCIQAGGSLGTKTLRTNW